MKAAGPALAAMALVAAGHPAWTAPAARAGQVAGAPPVAPPLPADPLAAVAVESEITFTSGDLELAGTLALPPAGTGKKPFPAVLLIPGDPYEDATRDGNFFGLKLFRQIAQRLAAHGVASLRYDKRGAGASKGDLGKARLSDLAGDVRAALVYLRARPEIDAKAVAVAAHGVGTMILLPAVADAKARDGKLAAVIMLAASALPGDAAIMENRRFMVEDMPNKTDAARAEALAQSQRVIDAVKRGEGLGKFSPAVIARAETPFFKDAVTFDPGPYLRRVRAPVLVVQGKKDRQVAPAQANALARALKAGGNRRVTVILDPYINHLLMVAESGSVNEYPALGPKADPETIERIAAWAATTLAPGGAHAGGRR